MSLSDSLLEKNILPDSVIRWGIRQRLAGQLKEFDRGSEEENQKAVIAHIESLEDAPIAIETDAANEQHYELPPRFFELCLGKHLKYSSGYWNEDTRTLDEGEAIMLALTCERAELKDGLNILELGCGWGSLSLWMAEHYPGSKITSVSNSAPQRAHIEARAKERGLENLTVITCDMNAFEAPDPGSYDRVVSVEMFEHMKNYRKLMGKVAEWLKPGGKLFVHIFTHRDHAYHYEVKDDSDWMAKYFFTGGQMPSDHLLLNYQDQLKIQEHWRVDGTHYEKTSNAWLENMDRNSHEILPLLEETYGAHQTTKWWVYWRCFYMACAELWGYDGGREWFVSHYLFEKPQS